MSSVEELYAAGAGSNSAASSNFKNQNVALICLLGVGLGNIIPQDDQQALSMIRAVHIFFYLSSIMVYRQSIKNIDNTYTSFTSKNDFGMSNTEKAAARISAKSTINTIIFRGLLSGVFHLRSLYIVPLVASVAVDMFSLVENENFLAVMINSPLKKPHNIPRSKSGRLI